MNLTLLPTISCIHPVSALFLLQKKKEVIINLNVFHLIWLGTVCQPVSMSVTHSFQSSFVYIRFLFVFGFVISDTAENNSNNRQQL